ncbi:GDNF family receptor alpha-3 isoform X1 [Pelodiscus sinensis]|uniref:GDNF family receptor alpha-3 isoform X1 n=1 Tax=Pelodiscus sinensis TaxID=13735 RepID=UPI003F6CB378
MGTHAEPRDLGRLAGSCTGIPLLLGLLLCRAGGLLALPKDCIAAEEVCLSDPVCSATYQALENCSLDKTSFLPLKPHTRARCLDAELDLRSSSLLHCKCRRRMRRQKHCLHIYWTVHSGFTQGYFNLESSPYEDPAKEEPWKIDYNKLEALVSGSHLARSSENPCLKATHVCSLNSKCARLRTDYASNCTKGAESGGTCDQRKCRQTLRHFFKKVPESFTKRLLFCPCQDEFCGERRRKTIVPECSFQNSIKPNCLLLLDSCHKDPICRSQLADFQQNCQPAAMSPDGCAQHNHAACLQAYMGMIGTAMTPNYVGNSSTEVSLWCTCENSGNQREECDQIHSMFISNQCLKNSVQSQMNLSQAVPEGQEEISYTPSLSFQGNSTNMSPASKMFQIVETKIWPDTSEHNSMPMTSSVYSGAGVSWPPMALLLLLLLLSPP